MGKNLLSLPALRKLLARNRSDANASRAFSKSSNYAMKRREFIGMAGAVVVGANPVVKTLDSVTTGPFKFESDRRRAIFKLGKKECWVIDTTKFSGSPRLLVERTPEYIRVALKNAFYPGTNLPADLDCEVTQGITGWRMNLQLTLGGFKSKHSLEGWLSGRESARSGIQMDLPVCDFGDDRYVSLQGTGTADFRPDWTFNASGNRLAVIDSKDGKIAASAFTITVPQANEESIMAYAPGKRTKLLLRRGRSKWNVGQWMKAPDGWTLDWADNPFDEIVIEAGESDRGRIRQVLLAQPGSDRTNIELKGPKGWHNLYGDGFVLPLSGARCAWSYDGNDSDTALLARYSDEPVWLRMNNCSVELGYSEFTEPFEMVYRNNETPKVKCEPAVISASAPMDGAVTGPLLLQEGALMMLAIGAPPAVMERPQTSPSVQPSVRPPVQVKPVPIPVPAPAPTPAPAPPQVERTPGIKVEPITIPKGAIDRVDIGKMLVLPLHVSVVRPEDMLTLDFWFDNLQLKNEGEAMFLERKDAQKPAIFRVVFPPQSIGEQSFLEAGNESLAPGQIAASRLAGPTQLCFELPKGVNKINYSLEALLDWSKYEPVLAPVALPPPPPPITLGPIFGQIPAIMLPSATRVEIPKRPGEPATVPTAAALPSTAQSTIKRTGLVFNTVKPTTISAVAKPVDVFSVIQKIEIVEPKDYTSIELPYRLSMSPSSMAGWAHSLKPVKSGEWVELWHTRLGVKNQDGSVDEKSQYYRTLRAIWSPDYNADLSKKPAHFAPPNNANNPRLSLDSYDRFELVHLTSNPNLPDWRSRVVHTDQLMLTSLGGWLKSRYAADPPELSQQTTVPKVMIPSQAPGFSIESWQHRAAMGRDYFVKVVYRGYLYPFGHRAALVKVTERKIRQVQGRGLCAVLIQRMFIVVREPEKIYDNWPISADVNRRMPIRRVKIVTRQTPDLNVNKGGILNYGQSAFWPILPGAGDVPFKYHIVTEDLEGQTQEFSMPLAFFESSAILDISGKLKSAGAKTALENIITEIEKPASYALRTASFFGQNVSLAPSHPTKPGGTNFEAVSVRFTAVKGPDKTLPMMPVVDHASLLVPAIQQFVGAGAPAGFTWQRDYVKTGFGGVNDSLQAFLTFVENNNKPPAITPELSFSSDKAGGLVNPVLRLTGMSRLHGPVGAPGAKAAFDPNNPMAAGEPKGEGGAYGGPGLGDGIDPKELLGDAAKLFGGIALNQLLNLINFGSGDDPQLTNYYDADTNSIKTEFNWKPKLNKPVLVFVPGTGCKLQLNAQIIQKLDATPPKATVKGEINNFQIQLLRPATTFMTVQFEYFKFSSGTGKETSIDPKITSVTFDGPLKFVNTLKNYLNSGALGSGPCLDVTKDGVVAGFSLAIPSISVGVFTLENVRLGAMMTLPFTGDPMKIRFNFCEKNNPFALTVSMFGGGGFFTMTLGLNGMERMEAAFEFGASVSLNLGVASGSAHIMAGIYFAMEGDECELTGYLRCGGTLKVLGLIRISAEFYLSLTYQSAGNRVWGQAKLTVEIEILFFSISVTLTVEREFSNSAASASLGGVQVAALEPFAVGLPGATGGSDRLSFASLMSESDWTAYCGAFA